jgi:hypothetical protein
MRKLVELVETATQLQQRLFVKLLATSASELPD